MRDPNTNWSALIDTPELLKLSTFVVCRVGKRCPGGMKQKYGIALGLHSGLGVLLNAKPHVSHNLSVIQGTIAGVIKGNTRS